MNLSVIVPIATVTGAVATVASYITQINLMANQPGPETAGHAIQGKSTADEGTTMPATAKNVGLAAPASKHKRLAAIRHRIASWTRQKMAGAALSLGVLSGLIVYGVLYLAVPSPEPTVSASCQITATKLVPGAIIRITYHISSSQAFQVGLGAGLYDNNGNDHSSGYGDISNFTLPKGRTSVSRPVLLPPNLPVGYYEITGEIWPANEISGNGINTYADPTCGYFTLR